MDKKRGFLSLAGKRKFFFLIILVSLLSPLGDTFGQKHLTRALYWQTVGEDNVQCLLCPRRCFIEKGKRGYCGVRMNRQGELFTLAYNNPVAVAIDPIEKKPFFHVLPASGALSIAVAGCNLRCLFCQNWHISQKKPDETINYDLSPQDIVSLAKQYHAPSIVFTYTEPTVFYEYML
ncbi:MAG: radical SAM protein, partial [Candidatus Omnitrophota bacterium]